jgi:hypothetical protein
MTHRQRNKAVEAQADLILADEPSLEAYAAYFETQIRRGIRMSWTSVRTARKRGPGS